MQTGDSAGENAIQFFGKRLLEISCPQACLHMRDRNTSIERGQRPAQCRGRISLHYRQIRYRVSQWLFQCVNYTRRGLTQCLSPLHDVQIVIRGYAEGRKHLVEHVAMLACDADLS